MITATQKQSSYASVRNAVLPSLFWNAFIAPTERESRESKMMTLKKPNSGPLSLLLGAYTGALTKITKVEHASFVIINEALDACR